MANGHYDATTCACTWPPCAIGKTQARKAAFIIGSEAESVTGCRRNITRRCHAALLACMRLAANAEPSSVACRAVCPLYHRTVNSGRTRPLHDGVAAAEAASYASISVLSVTVLCCCRGRKSMLQHPMGCGLPLHSRHRIKNGFFVEFGTPARSLSHKQLGRPPETRTRNQRIKSPLLYQLS